MRNPGLHGLIESSLVRWRFGFCLCLLLVASSCRSLPDEGWAQLKDVRLRLLSVQADRFTPSEYSAFERHFSDIREDFSRLANQAALLRSGSRIAALDSNIRALNATGEALVSQAEKARQSKLEALRLEAAALESYLTTTGPSHYLPELRQSLTGTQLQLARLKLLIEQGDDRSAEAVLNVLKASNREVRAHLDELERRFSDPHLLRVWSRLCQKAIEFSRRTDQPVLVIEKFDRKAFLLRRGRVFRRFSVDLGWNGLNDKQRQGDGATPEGEYTVTKKKSNEHTNFHRALLLSYPNEADKAAFQQALRRGEVPRGSRIGSMIEIHGAGGRGQDWTDGCIALSNREIELLYRDAYVGMPVYIVGRCQLLR